MKVYLLNAPFHPGFVRCGRWQGVTARGITLYYPIWLSYATGNLEKNGISTKLVDAPASKLNLNQIIADIEDYNPDLLVVDTNFSSVTNDVNIINSVKKVCKDLYSCVVGPPASVYYDRIFKMDGVDFIAVYEYDQTLVDLSHAIQAKLDYKEVKGLYYKEKMSNDVIQNEIRPFLSQQELDEIPFVSSVYKKHLDIKNYCLDHSLNPEVQIVTSRGCPNNCTFCSWPETFTGRQYRFRSVENVIEEFEYIIKNFKMVKEIFIEDDTFTINKKRVEAFTQRIEENNIKISWSCNARANLSYEIMKKMKKANCRLLDVGYESGSVEILKNIRKGVTKEQMIDFTHDAKRAGLMILGDFVFGFQGENKTTAQETLRFVKKLKPNIVQFAIATPMPGTQFYNWAKDNNYLLADYLEQSIDINGFQKCIVSYPDFTSTDIENAVDSALKSYYLNIGYVPIALRNVFRKNGLTELKNMIRSARRFFSYMRARSDQKSKN